MNLFEKQIQRQKIETFSQCFIELVRGYSLSYKTHIAKGKDFNDYYVFRAIKRDAKKKYKDKFFLIYG